jgi:AcrR family transcriptional regulator
MSARTEAKAATRDRIAHATLPLLLNWAYEEVTLESIAEAAGVSHQTVLNHYGSKEGAALAAIELLREQTDHVRQQARGGDVASVVAALMTQYERFGDANVRWAMAGERLGRLGSLVRAARRAHHDWLQRVLANRLPASANERRRTVNALHAVTDVYTWKLLRRDLSLGRAETERTMATMVEALLEPEDTQ